MAGVEVAVSELRPDRDADAVHGEDFEYDMAHEATTGSGGAEPVEVPRKPPDVSFGDGGDYGYDLAHDMRSS